jgi:hypothetical protein
MMRVPRLVALFMFVVGSVAMSSDTGSAQGTGGRAIITVTVTDSYGGAVQGATVTAIDGDSSPTTEGPITTDMAGQVQLTNFVVGDAVTISAQPPAGVTVSGSSTTVTLLYTPMAVTLALGTSPAAPTPTPVSVVPPTATPVIPDTSGPMTTLTVRTVNTQGTTLPGAGYTIFLPDSTSRFGMDGDDGANDGVSTYTGLPVGAAVTVSQTTVPPDSAGAGDQTIVLTSFSGANLLTFTNHALAVATETPATPLSQVTVRALLCENAGLSGQTEYTHGDVIAPERCPAADAVTFTFTGTTTGQTGAAAGAVEAVTDATGATAARLPAGSYTISNGLAAGTTPLEVDGVSVYHVTAVIYLSAGFVTPTPTPQDNGETPPARLTGDAQFTVMVCTNPAQAGSVEFQVGEPGGNPDATGSTTRVGATIPDGCAPSAAEMSIVPFSDPSATTMAVSVGATGFLVLDDLPSTVDREPHLLAAVATGGTYQAPFDIDPGAMTEIVVRVYLGGTGNPPAAGTPDVGAPTAVAPPPTTGDGTGGYSPGGAGPGNGAMVTNLPVTGSGSGTPVPLLLALLTVAALASGVGLHRRASRR